MATIDEILNRTVKHFFRQHPNPLVNGVCIGYLPRSTAAEILVFIDPAAPKCEAECIKQELDMLCGRQPHRHLRASRFVGLQGAAPTSIGPNDTLQYNVPEVNAGTLSAVVAVGETRYLLGSNHVIAHNGRVSRGTSISTPGPLDVTGGGVSIGTLAQFVELRPPGFPLSGEPANRADCALALVTGVVNATTKVDVLAIPDPPEGTIPITKTGRSTQTKRSEIRIFRWSGYIDFGFGIYFFEEMLGTYDGREIFAAPGDSGSLALDDAGRGVGLITARAYVFESEEFVSYMILLCSLTAVRNALAAPGLLGVSTDQISFSHSSI
jgi:hypothetical protein